MTFDDAASAATQRPLNLGFDESAQPVWVMPIDSSQHNAVDVDDVCFIAHVFINLK